MHIRWYQWDGRGCVLLYRKQESERINAEWKFTSPSSFKHFFLTLSSSPRIFFRIESNWKTLILYHHLLRLSLHLYSNSHHNKLSCCVKIRHRPWSRTFIELSFLVYFVIIVVYWKVMGAMAPAMYAHPSSGLLALLLHQKFWFLQQYFYLLIFYGLRFMSPDKLPYTWLIR